MFAASAVLAEDDPVAASNADEEAKSALAEQVVTASFNKDRIKTVKGEVRELKVSLLRIEKKQLGIKGKAQDVKGQKVDINEELRKIGAKELETEIKIVLPGSLLFAFDKSDLRPDAVDTLDRLAAIVKDFDKSKIRVEGHTDWMGTDEYNEALSLRRANAVRDWLVKHGAAAPRMSVQGFGESKPVDTNETDAGRQNNRRVEVIIEKTGKK